MKTNFISLGEESPTKHDNLNRLVSKQSFSSSSLDSFDKPMSLKKQNKKANRFFQKKVKEMIKKAKEMVKYNDQTNTMIRNGQT